MTQNQDSHLQTTARLAWQKPLLLGAAIGLVFMTLFLLGAADVNPWWGRYWMVRPLAVIALAGAGGGLCYAVLNYWSLQGKLNRTAAILISAVLYLVALWMGSVVGLDGTLWD